MNLVASKLDGTVNVASTAGASLFHVFDRDRVAAMKADGRCCAAAFHHGFGVALKTHDVRGRLGAVHCPTSLLAGKDDSMTPPVQGALRFS